MPDPEGSLADLFAACAEPIPCPPPPPVPPYFIRVTLVPDSGYWLPGDELTIDAQSGILNRIGGGHCWVTEAQVHRTLGGESVSSLPGNYNPPDCVVVPETPLDSMVAVSLLAVALLTRARATLSR